MVDVSAGGSTWVRQERMWKGAQINQDGNNGLYSSKCLQVPYRQKNSQQKGEQG